MFYIFTINPDFYLYLINSGSFIQNIQFSSGRWIQNIHSSSDRLIQCIQSIKDADVENIVYALFEDWNVHKFCRLLSKIYQILYLFIPIIDEGLFESA